MNIENIYDSNFNKIISSHNTSDLHYQDLKHFFEGYRETILTCLYNEQFVEDLNIDVERYSPGSARRVSYENGKQQALKDISGDL